MTRNIRFVESRCPNCGEVGVFVFYRVSGVPVHSCVLLDSYREARDYPTGEIELAFCRSCGFIFNSAFDPSRVDYTQPYEDQQTFSPTFNLFASQLATELVEKYQLRGKKILEIGCGKGDFLAALCRLGPNTGIGIDPALRRERIPIDLTQRIECVQDYFSGRYTGYDADFICCRHTLEHVANTLEFMATVREIGNGRAGTPVFFEVPDTERVLKEAAFWDIYYEHCSYFTPASIRNLFVLAGFEVVNVELAYGEQYLLVEGVFSNGTHKQGRSWGLDVDGLWRSVQDFTRSVNRKMAGWRSRLSDMNREGKKVAIWGSGSKAVGFLTTLSASEQVGAIVDINRHRQGKYIPAVVKEIAPPEALKSFRPDVVIVMNPIYREEISGQLVVMGLEPDILVP